MENNIYNTHRICKSEKYTYKIIIVILNLLYIKIFWARQFSLFAYKIEYSTIDWVYMQAIPIETPFFKIYCHLKKNVKK